MSVRVVVEVARLDAPREAAVELTCVDRDIDAALTAVAQQLPPGWHVVKGTQSMTESFSRPAIQRSLRSS